VIDTDAWSTGLRVVELDLDRAGVAGHVDLGQVAQRVVVELEFDLQACNRACVEDLCRILNDDAARTEVGSAETRSLRISSLRGATTMKACREARRR